MTTSSIFAGRAARLRHFMTQCMNSPSLDPSQADAAFNALAMDWFAVQFDQNVAYQQWCKRAGVAPEKVGYWTEIPAMPTAAFKELEVTSLSAADRTSVFHSSGTTEQRPSRHFHSADSIALYETSLLAWFESRVLGRRDEKVRLLSLTPSTVSAPRSSLVHMFETLRRENGDERSGFFGGMDDTGAWTLDSAGMEAAIHESSGPVILLGTAFSYVNWIDELIAGGRRLRLPGGSRVLETGGYKGRSRTLPKAELHQLIEERLGVGPGGIICEYGMSELSSQAYDVQPSQSTGSTNRCFRFPPWARVVVVSPETGREVRDGETGLVRVIDLANLWSVSAVQTEDLAIRRGAGFELIGRAATAEARGCSLMNH